MSMINNRYILLTWYYISDIHFEVPEFSSLQQSHVDSVNGESEFQKTT